MSAACSPEPRRSQFLPCLCMAFLSSGGIWQHHLASFEAISSCVSLIGFSEITSSRTARVFCCSRLSFFFFEYAEKFQPSYHRRRSLFLSGVYLFIYLTIPSNLLKFKKNLVVWNLQRQWLWRWRSCEKGIRSIKSFGSRSQVLDF